MSENPKKSLSKPAAGKGLTQIFVKAKALQEDKKDDGVYYSRDYYVNLAEISCMFDSGDKVVLWRSAAQGMKITSYEIPNMNIEKCARALATQGVALVDLEEINDRIEKKQAAAKFKPVKL